MTSRLPESLELVSLGAEGTGTYLMLNAIADALVEAGAPARPSVVAAPDRDGGAAMIRVSEGGEGVLGACSPAYLTTPIVHGIDVTWRTLTPIARLVTDSYLLVAPTATASSAAELFSRPTTAVVPKAGGNTDIQAMLLGGATGNPVTVLVEHDRADLRAALFDGRAHWTTGVYSDFAAEFDAGTLEVLATFEDAATGDKPTLVQQGIDVTFPLWRGVMAPGGLRDELITEWDAALRDATTRPAWLQYASTQRQNTDYLAAPEFAELLAEEDGRYRRWLTALER